MAILDLIESLDKSGDELVRRVPEQGSGEFRLGSQLVVRESQAAVFFRDGKSLDTFGPGRHTLTTANIPLLTGLLGLPFGGRSPFRAEVYFVTLRELLELKWGTPEPIAYRDADLGVVRLRSFGTYSMQISNPQLFVNKVVGTMGYVTTAQVQTYLRSVIVMTLTDTLGEMLSSVFDLPRQYQELGIAVRVKARDSFASLGLDLRTLFVNAITPPDDVQKAIDERSSMGAIGTANMPAYLQYKTAQAIGDAAKGGGGGDMAGTAQAGMGLGMGAGLGMLIPQIIGQAGQQQQQVLLCSNCQAKVPQGSKFCPSCGIQFGVGQACPNCQAPLPAGSKFCPQCGHKST
jgi:membrane protease subunit (stomatin/prohibitin family)